MAEDFGHWKSPVDTIPEGALGFIYKITHIPSGRVYIGKKLLYKSVKMKPLKGKTRARRKTKDSDWRTYMSSSWEIEEMLKTEPKEAFSCEILRFCSCKWELAYFEAKIQMDLEVLFHPETYINGIINIRLSKAPKGIKP